jgi:uncharacterized flavoprotein (TIGR03862 family)
MSSPAQARVAVIGGGPAGLMAAEALAAAGMAVTVFDRMPTLARKFLLAGRGGLNLTHSEPLDRLLARYGAAEPRLRAAIEAFPPAELRAWCEGLGQPTFVGSSRRVFPTALKASPLLRAWLRRLTTSGVTFAPRHAFTGWDAEERLRFATPKGEMTLHAEATVLALGGASWPRLGADGSWVDVLTRAGIAVTPLRPANCGFLIAWPDAFRDRFAGQPLKRIALACGDSAVRGEAVVTRSGIEGGAVYALSAVLREAIAAAGEAGVHLDLKPDLAAEDIARRLAVPRGKQSLANFLRKTVRLEPVAIALLQVAAAGQLAALTAAELVRLIKAVPLTLVGTAPLARAISTAGGIALDEIDANFMLRRRPGIFVAGEMLDWEAPTGGYLLQACLATGAAAGRGATAWLRAGGAS